jgi:hypothetical protein
MNLYNSLPSVLLRRYHRLYRVPGFLSSRQNWSPHPLTRKGMLLLPPFGPRGGDSLVCGGGVGGPNSDEGTDTRNGIVKSLYGLQLNRRRRNKNQFDPC